jgi:hypothetical protein
MNEFDRLLNEVLRQDGTQQLPPGMKERILAALPAGRNLFSGQRAIRVGTAAALLIGVFGAAMWTIVRTKSGLTVAPASKQVSLTMPVDRAKLAASHSPGPSSSAHAPNGRKLSVYPSIHPRPALQQSAIWIAPVAIEPLVIKPIEIASLKPSGSTMKGTIR